MQDIAPRRRATYADVLAAPEHLVAEIIDGELVTMPRPAPRHLVSGSNLTSLLNGPFDLGRGGPGGWWIIAEPELHLGDEILVLDIAGWRRERMPVVPENPYFTLAPDWMCEIRSPSSAKYDRGPKRQTYARHGVGHCWYVETAARLLECYELRDGLWVLLKTFAENDEVDAPPFEAAPFPLGLLWAD